MTQSLDRVSSPSEDPPLEVSRGEPSALDIEVPRQLVQWLRRRGHVGPTERPRIRVLKGGVSNRTVRVERAGGEAWVLKQALPKLRVEVEWFSAPERVQREALGMQWLGTLAPEGTTVPLVFEDPTHHLIAMQAVPEPHANWKDLLLAATPDPEHIRLFGTLLGTIHRNAQLRADPLQGVFGDTTFFEGLRLEPFYEYTATTVPEASDFLRALATETRATRQTLVHGDFSPKNILIHGGRMILVDHEVIHWGDPMFDVGFATAHLLCKAHRFPVRRRAFADAAVRFWNHYRLTIGQVTADTEARAVRHLMGCLLARAAGRSPVNYLSPTARGRQCRAIARVLPELPETVCQGVSAFLEALSRLSR